MLRFFDYVYYTIWKFYNRYEKGAGFKALLALVAIQSANCLSILFLISFFYLHKKISDLEIVTFIIFFILFVLEFIRYNSKKYNYKVLNEWWGNERDNIKYPKHSLVQLYITLSICLFLFSVIYGGIHHNDYH